MNVWDCNVLGFLTTKAAISLQRVGKAPKKTPQMTNKWFIVIFHPVSRRIEKLDFYHWTPA